MDAELMQASERRSAGRPKDDTRRHELVQETMRLLQKTSPTELSRLSIARAAGVDPGLIRYYFGDKNNLFGEVVQLIADDIVVSGTSALNGTGSARQRLAGFVRESHAVHMRHPHYHQLVLHQINHGRGDSMRELRSKMSHILRTDLFRVLADGQASGEFRVVDPGLLGIAIIGMCEYFSSSWGPVAALLNEESEHERPRSAAVYGAFIEDLVVRALDPAPLTAH